MKFEQKISKSKIDKIEKFYADSLQVFDEDFYSTQLNVRFIAKGTEFYMKLPLRFKFDKSKIKGNVNQTKIYMLSLIITALIASLMYVVWFNFKTAIIFGGVSGFISYLMFRKNVKTSLSYFYKSVLKFFVIGFFISSSFSCFSQSNNDSIIYFKPVFVNQCTGEVLAFIKSTNKSNDSIIMNLKFNQFEYRQYAFSITNKDADTVNIPKLKIFNVVSDPTSYYIYCDSSANGYLEDYYYNGQLRIKGTFKDSYPIDTIFKYYITGELKEQEFVDTNYKSRILSYYKNGNLKEDYNQIDGEFITYYESGQIKEISIGHYNFVTKGYYKTGDVWYTDEDFVSKEFYENGKLKEQLFKKELWKLDRMLHPKDYPYYSSRFFNHYWLSYNSKGKLIRKIIFDETYFYYDFESQNNLDKIETQNIESVLFYKNGKKYKLIEYDYTKKTHYLYEYVKHKKVLISTIEENKVKDLINQIDKEIE